MSVLRRPGGRWRLLVHTYDPKTRTYPHSHHVQPRPGKDGPHSTVHVLAGTEFDELVVGRWLHVEQMDTGTWWLNIAGVTVHVNADRDGQPRWVYVNGPGTYDEPTLGCQYYLDWSEATP